MKIYIQKESACCDHPDDLAEIMDYLTSRGTLLVSEGTVESLYRQFSDERYSAGWLMVNPDILDEFADWLAEIDL